MTTPSTDDIRAKLSANALDLRKARDDAALYERLKAAASEVTRLQKEGTALTTALHEATVREANDARAALAATFRNFRIEDREDIAGNGSVLARTFIIRFDRLQHDPVRRENVWVPREITGFASLPDDVFAYMMQSKRDALPGSLLALVPDDPEAAMERYFNAKQRGFLVGL